MHVIVTGQQMGIPTFPVFSLFTVPYQTINTTLYVLIAPCFEHFMAPYKDMSHHTMHTH